MICQWIFKIKYGVGLHRSAFHGCPSHPLFNDFSFRYRNSKYFAVISLVTLGLAWVSPEPDLPLPSLGYARDIKRSFPLEHNNQFQSREKFGLYICSPNFSRDWHLLDYSSFSWHFSHIFPSFPEWISRKIWSVNKNPKFCRDWHFLILILIWMSILNIDSNMNVDKSF